jgi:hypothetical protein
MVLFVTWNRDDVKLSSSQVENRPAVGPPDECGMPVVVELAVPGHVIAMTVCVGHGQGEGGLLPLRRTFGEYAPHRLPDREIRARQQAVSVLHRAGIEQYRLVRTHQKIHEVTLGAIAFVLANDDGVGVESINLKQRVGVGAAIGRTMDPVNIGESGHHSRLYRHVYHLPNLLGRHAPNHLQRRVSVHDQPFQRLTISCIEICPIFLISSPPGLAGPAAHETLLFCGRVVGTEVAIRLVQLSPFISWTRGSLEHVRLSPPAVIGPGARFLEFLFTRPTPTTQPRRRRWVRFKVMRYAVDSRIEGGLAYGGGETELRGVFGNS